MRAIDGKWYVMPGERYGRLVVKEFSGTSTRGQTKWLCICNCGNPHTVLGDDLKRERTRSCGCLRRESARVRAYEIKIWNKGGLANAKRLQKIRKAPTRAHSSSRLQDYQALHRRRPRADREQH